MTIDRRRFLAGSLAAAALGALIPSRTARAIGPSSRFRIAQLIIPDGNWDPRPTALRRLLTQVQLRTSIDVPRDPVVQIRPESEKLHRTPFLYLAGDRAFAPLSAPAVEALRRFLTFGGFLLVDSAEGRLGGGFDASVRRLLADVFPRPSPGLQPISPDHVVYKSFYLVDAPSGRLALTDQMEGILQGGRLLVAYCQNDLGGAWARNEFGEFDYECYPGGERQREMAYRFGVNLAMYALCLDYKADQVHIPFILKRREWKAAP